MTGKKSSRRRKSKRPLPASSAVPRSWELRTWPPAIWPHTAKRAQWIGRAYRDELLAAGAITRIGPTLVFIGAEYETWLKLRANHVVEFQGNLGSKKSIEAQPQEA